MSMCHQSLFRYPCTSNCSIILEMRVAANRGLALRSKYPYHSFWVSAETTSVSKMRVAVSELLKLLHHIDHSDGDTWRPGGGPSGSHSCPGSDQIRLAVANSAAVDDDVDSADPAAVDTADSDSKHGPNCTPEQPTPIFTGSPLAQGWGGRFAQSGGPSSGFSVVLLPGGFAQYLFAAFLALMLDPR